MLERFEQGAVDRESTVIGRWVNMVYLSESVLNMDSKFIEGWTLKL